MAVQNKVLYAFRGWIAFVAFMDLGTAGRCFIERRSFLHSMSSQLPQPSDDFTVSRMLGMYSILKALALIHCTLYIHYRPVVSLGYWALSLTIALYCSEALYFHSTSLNFYVIFPCILNTLTLVGLVYLPRQVKLWGPPASEIVEDENSLLLRQIGQRAKHKRNKGHGPNHT